MRVPKIGPPIPSVLDKFGKPRPVYKVVDELIAYTVWYYGGNATDAAEVLGVSRSTIYRRLREAIERQRMLERIKENARGTSSRGESKGSGGNPA